jgi:hypothetical protein
MIMNPSSHPSSAPPEGVPSSHLVCPVTVSQLLRTLEGSNAQCITIFRDGSGHFVMAQHSAPRFHSLPELSRFVDQITARPVAAEVTRLTNPPTQTANAS